MKKILFIISLLLINISATIDQGKKEYFPSQIVDHFNPLDNRTFIQKYFIYNQFFNLKEESPVILYISGEGECKKKINKKKYLLIKFL